MNGYPNAQPQRVILANKPRLLRGMLKHVLQKDPGLKVVGEVLDLEDLARTVEETGAGWVIVSLPPDGKIPDLAEAVLISHPSINLLAVAMDGSQIKLKWIGPQEKELNCASIEDLMDVLHQS